MTEMNDSKFIIYFSSHIDKYIDDLEGERGGDLLVGEAGGDELVLGDQAVLVVVHLLER